MQVQATPILLFNDECGVCRKIAHWVEKSAAGPSGGPCVVVRPIGDDPEALRAMNPKLDIWDAYETIHILMPDGSMKVGGEAVAEVFRRLPNCKWFAWAFRVHILGFHPFQLLLDLGYLILSDARPLFGCESCGIPRPWVKAIRSVMGKKKGKSERRRPTKVIPRFTVRPARPSKSSPPRNQRVAFEAVWSNLRPMRSAWMRSMVAPRTGPMQSAVQVRGQRGRGSA